MLEDLKLLLGITSDDKDELLELLIKQAQQEFQRLTNRKEVAEFKSVILKMAVFNYNRLGSEGLSSESYAGTSYTYREDYPESLLKEIKAVRVLRILW